MQNLAMKIQQSPFKNIYWFARALVNTDKYSAIGSNHEAKLLRAVAEIEIILSSHEMSDDQKLLVAKNYLAEIINNFSKAGTKQQAQHLDFWDFLNKEIQTVNDMIVFCITVKYVAAPINAALKTIPSSDIGFCVKTARMILENYGETSAGTVIAVWDELGVKGCLNAERVAVVDKFSSLLDNLTRLTIQHDTIDDNMIMTAFVQEFERRLGQKRKARGGHSLESVMSFYLIIINFHQLAGRNILTRILKLTSGLNVRTTGLSE